MRALMVELKDSGIRSQEGGRLPESMNPTRQQVRNATSAVFFFFFSGYAQRGAGVLFVIFGCHGWVVLFLFFWLEEDLGRKCISINLRIFLFPFGGSPVSLFIVLKRDENDYYYSLNKKERGNE